MFYERSKAEHLCKIKIKNLPQIANQSILSI